MDEELEVDDSESEEDSDEDDEDGGILPPDLVDLDAEAEAPILGDSRVLTASPWRCGLAGGTPGRAR